MVLFCDGNVILPEHVVFPPDLKPNAPLMQPAASGSEANGSGDKTRNLSLAGAVARHVKFVYEQAGHNQRRTARLLGISRATLARHLRRKSQN